MIPNYQSPFFQTEAGKKKVRKSKVIAEHNSEFILKSDQIAYASLEGLLEHICEPICDEETRKSFIYTFKSFVDQNFVLRRFLELYKKNEYQRQTIIQNVIIFS